MPRRRSPNTGRVHVHTTGRSTADPTAVPDVVSDEALRLAVSVLKTNGIYPSRPVVSDLFDILKRVLSRDAGNPIRVKASKTPRRRSRIIKALTAGPDALLTCQDWGSWIANKNTGSRPRPRHLIPSNRLILANLKGDCLVSSVTDFYRSAYVQPKPTPGRVVACSASGVLIPGNVSEALTLGTGLALDWTNAESIIMRIADPVKQRQLLIDTKTAANRHGQQIIPDEWNQKLCGRLYARRPPVQTLPKVIRYSPALTSIDGAPLFEIDFRNYEFRLAMAIYYQYFPDVQDVYKVLGDSVGMTRDDIKHAINPILHKRRQNNILFNPKLTGEQREQQLHRHRMVLDVIAQHGGLPNLAATMRQSGKHDLQRTGARLLYSCMSASLEDIKCPGGLQLHDGWVFQADNSNQARQVVEVFQSRTRDMLGGSIPVELKAVSE